MAQQFSTTNAPHIEGDSRTGIPSAVLARGPVPFICCLSLWKQVAKIERMRRFGKEKSMRRTQELAGVKGAFRNFANELDETLNQAMPRAASDGRNAII